MHRVVRARVRARSCLRCVDTGAQGSAYTWELWPFSNVYKTQTEPRTPTGTHVVHRRRRAEGKGKDGGGRGRSV